MRWIVLAGALFFTACSALAPQLEAPNLSVVGMELLESDIFQQRVKLKLRVQNPNDRELPVKGVSTQVELNGEEFATGVSSAQFTVPALGESEFDMIITANMAGMLVQVLGRKGGKDLDPIEYRVKGKVSLASGLLRSIPFDEKGTLKLE
ncbi:MAG TPA: LEA type 2 family protein [Steroidobacteraceae bacterium]|nr:LEA type 2 family protein [Steroidobacteraceae bacterium]